MIKNMVSIIHRDSVPSPKSAQFAFSYSSPYTTNGTFINLTYSTRSYTVPYQTLSSWNNHQDFKTPLIHTTSASSRKHCTVSNSRQENGMQRYPTISSNSASKLATQIRPSSHKTPTAYAYTSLFTSTTYSSQVTKVPRSINSCLTYILLFIWGIFTH